MSQEAPVGGEAAPARDAADLKLPKEDLTPGRELVDRRTATTKTFAGEEPGTFESKVFGAPVHFEDEDGQWVDIDTDLVEASGDVLVPAASDLEVAIAASSGAEELVRVSLGEDTSVGWSLTPPVAAGARSARPEPVEGDVRDSTMVFEEVVPGVGMKLESTPRGVKEDLVLDGPGAPTTYEFPLALEGVRAVEAGGGVHFLDGAGEVVGAIPAGFMVDAAGELSEDVTLALVGDRDAPVLRVDIDGGWLAEADRVFPVEVDPTVQLTTGVEDTHVESTRPTTNFSGYTFMRVGLQGSKRSRGLIRFDTPALDGKTIDYADLHLWNRVSATCTAFDVSLYNPTQDWDRATVAWPGPARGERVGLASTPRGGPGCAPGRLTFRVSEVVRDWTSGQAPNRGLNVQTSEGTTNAYREFSTSEAVEGQQPFLNVSWRESLLGQLGYYTTNTQQLTDRTQASVNVANGNLMVAGADLQLPEVAGHDLNIGRSYNSREDTRAIRAGLPGTGWTMNVGPDIRFSVNGFSEDGYFEGPSGYRIVFPYNEFTGSYDKPAGLNATVTRSGSTGFDYTVEMHDTAMKYHFRGGPALDEIEDQHGNTIMMNYGSGERLSSITDTKGGVTRFAYNNNGFVTSVTDPDGRAARYAYTGADLTSSTDFAGAVTSYAYDSEHNMTSLTDPEGGVTRFAYDTKDRLTSITWADSTAAAPSVTRYEYLSGNRAGPRKGRCVGL